MRPSSWLLGLGALTPSLAAQLPPPTTGDLLVSSSANDRLLRLDFRGTELAAATYPGLAHPRGIVVAPDSTIYLVSQNSSEVLVLDRALQLVRRFPASPVVSPTGMALGPNGNLFVAGFGSSNIGEFRTDGSLVRTHSAPELVATNCVAFLSDGSFVAASAGNGKVVHFEPSGSVRRSFTGFGLSSPMGIAVYGNEMFVAGGSSNNLVVFDLQGVALREIRHANIAAPQGVAMTAAGVLVTTSFSNAKVSWFQRDGTHLSSVQPPSSLVPRSAAFLPSVTLVTSGTPGLGVPFPLLVSCPHEPGQLYAAPLALSTTPGLPLPDGRTFALTPDALFVLSLSIPGFTGRLDANGLAQPILLLPNDPSLHGVPLHAGAVTLDFAVPTLFRQVSGPSSWIL